MRVADILTSTADESDGDDRFSMISGPSADARHRNAHSALRRLIPSCRISLFKPWKKSWREKAPDRTAVAEPSVDGSEAGASLPACSVPLSGTSEQYMKEMSFNLGAGFGLFLLTSANQRELDKMKELRTQMEVILQDIKGEFRRKYTISRSFDSNDTPASSTTDAQEAPKFDIHHSFQYNTPSYILPDSEIAMMSDESSKCHELGQQEFSGRMDQLATELEAELELLELHLDQEHSQKHSQGVEISVEDISSEGSLSIRFEEAVDSLEEPSGDPHGIRPNELERKLHELLEARQQERINELEAALEYTKHKLHEKEIEAKQWKDTARLFSQQFSETPLPTPHHVKQISHMSR